MIWIFHFIFITILLLIAKYIKSDKFFINTSFFYAIFIFGQRWMTGTDFPNYLNYYLTDFSSVEPLYYWIQKFLSSNGLYFGILIFIILLITLFNNYRFFLKFDRHVILIIYLFLFSEIFFAQLSQIRQFVAVSFFLNSYFYSFENKYGKSLINILFGLGFHSSIIFFVPFLFIKLNLNKIKTIYLLLLSSILPLLDVAFILRLPIFDRYSHYLDSIFNVNLSIFHYVKFYIILAVLLFVIWNIEHFRENKMTQIILNGLVLNMLFYGISFQFGIMLRVSMYFKVFEFIFLAYYYKDVFNVSKKIMKFAVILLFMGIYSGLALTDPYDISRYEFSPLRINETRSVEELNAEIDRFYGRL